MEIKDQTIQLKNKNSIVYVSLPSKFIDLIFVSTDIESGSSKLFIYFKSSLKKFEYIVSFLRKISPPYIFSKQFEILKRVKKKISQNF